MPRGVLPALREGPCAGRTPQIPAQSSIDLPSPPSMVLTRVSSRLRPGPHRLRYPSSECRHQDRALVGTDELCVVDRARHPGPLAEEQQSIHQQLLAIHQRLGTAKALANPNFTGWLNHLKWLSLFPPILWTTRFSRRNPPGPPPQTRPDSVPARRFPRPLSLRRSARGSRNSLPDLSVPTRPRPTSSRPCGRDQPRLRPALSGWLAASLRRSVPCPARTRNRDRFAYFVAVPEDGTPLYDLKRLSVSDLKFVVDTPVSLRELKYVQRVKMRDVKQLHDLF